MAFDAEKFVEGVRAKRTSVLVGTGFLLGTAVWSSDMSSAAKVVEMFPAPAAKVVLTFALAILVLGFHIYFSFPRYTQDTKYQLPRGKRDGLLYCPSCLNAHRRTVLRHGTQEKRWYCPDTGCKASFPDPDYVERRRTYQSRQRSVQQPQSWMR